MGWCFLKRESWRIFFKTFVLFSKATSYGDRELIYWGLVMYLYVYELGPEWLKWSLGDSAGPNHYHVIFKMSISFRTQCVHQNSFQWQLPSIFHDWWQYQVTPCKDPKSHFGQKLSKFIDLIWIWIVSYTLHIAIQYDRPKLLATR